MKSDNYKEYSVSEMTAALINRVFEKKRTRVTAAVIMLFVSIFCVRELHSGWHIMENTVFSYILSIVLFAAAILSGAVLLSCFGAFKSWKFNTGASVSALLLWGATVLLGVFTTMYACSADEARLLAYRLLHYTAPMFAVSLGTVILTGMLYSRREKRTE